MWNGTFIPDALNREKGAERILTTCTDMHETLSPENQNSVSVDASFYQSKLVSQKFYL